MGKKDKESVEEKVPIVIKNATDLQRLRIEKLLKNPNKPVVIPEGPKQKSLAPPPDFVRNVMGSSAGAGSGEFHVYRHLRRKEYARQKFIQEKSEKEKLDDEYHRKVEENKRIADEKTAKKRAKRLKRKEMLKKTKRNKKSDKTDNSVKSECDDSSQSHHDDDDDGDEEEEESPKVDKSYSNESMAVA